MGSDRCLDTKSQTSLFSGKPSRNSWVQSLQPPVVPGLFWWCTASVSCSCRMLTCSVCARAERAPFLQTQVPVSTVPNSRRKRFLHGSGRMIVGSGICRACSVELSLSLGTSKMTDVVWGRGWKRREAIYMYIYQTAWLVQLITAEIRSVLLMLISAVSSEVFYSLWLEVCK